MSGEIVRGVESKAVVGLNDLLMDPDFANFKKAEDEAALYAYSLNSKITLTVLKDGPARIIHRRLQQPNMKPPVFRSVLLAELDGVRVYIRNHSIIVTKQKLQP